MRELIEKLSQIMPILLIFFVFYFFIMRPQRKKALEHQDMLKRLKRGDTVVMTGGLVGTVERLVDETYLSLCIKDDICITVLRSAVAEIVPQIPVIKVDLPGDSPQDVKKKGIKARVSKTKTSQ